MKYSLARISFWAGDAGCAEGCDAPTRPPRPGANPSPPDAQSDGDARPTVSPVESHISHHHHRVRTFPSEFRTPERALLRLTQRRRLLVRTALCSRVRCGPVESDCQVSQKLLHRRASLGNFESHVLDRGVPIKARLSRRSPVRTHESTETIDRRDEQPDRTGFITTGRADIIILAQCTPSDEEDVYGARARTPK